MLEVLAIVQLTEVGLLNKSSRLAATLGVTKFITVMALIPVTLLCCVSQMLNKLAFGYWFCSSLNGTSHSATSITNVIVTYSLSPLRHSAYHKKCDTLMTLRIIV
jgi:hypothetical protein